MNTINNNLLEKAMTYTQYRALIDRLMAEDKTTGTNQDPELVEYARMNIQRMKRLDKTVVLTDGLMDTLDKVNFKIVWLVFTEGWCGDAAQNIPALAKMADYSPNIELKLILRDEFPELMDQYLTNGTRSIPKLVALKADTLEELGTWGARPEPAQDLIVKYKANPTIPFKEFAEQLHAWYAKDKTLSLQHEFQSLLKQWT